MKRKPARKQTAAMPADPADRAAWLERLPKQERRRQEAAIRKRFPPGEPGSWPEWLRCAWLFGFLPDEYQRAHGESHRAERADRLLAEIRQTGIEPTAAAARVIAETAAGRPSFDVPFAHVPAWKMDLPEPEILAPPPLKAAAEEAVRTADRAEFQDTPPRTTVLVGEDGEAYVGEVPDDEYARLCRDWKKWSPADRLEYLTGFAASEHLENQQEAERIWSAGRLLDEIRSAGIEAAVEDVRFLEEVFARPMPCHAPHREDLERHKRPRPGPLFENVPPDVLAALAPDSAGFKVRRAHDRRSLGPHLGRANDEPEYFAEARAANVHGRRLRKGESWESRAAIVFRLLLAARHKAHDRLGEDVAFPYRSAAGDTKNESARMILRHMLYVLGFIDRDNTRDSEDFRAGDRFAAIEAAVADARERKVADALRLTRSDMIEHAVLAGFAAARLLGPEESERVEKALRRLEVQEDNTESFLAEGRAAKAENDRKRAALICKLYKAVRPSHPEGRKGNGDANKAVAERYESQTGESVTVRTVRDTVKEAGLSDPPRRKGKR